MTENRENTALMVSARLREWIHDVNNALFIAKGYLEELQDEITSQSYLQPDFDHENFAEMIETVARSVGRIDGNLIKLRNYAKDDVFEQAGIKNRGAKETSP